MLKSLKLLGWLSFALTDLIHDSVLKLLVSTFTSNQIFYSWVTMLNNFTWFDSVTSSLPQENIATKWFSEKGPPWIDTATPTKPWNIEQLCLGMGNVARTVLDDLLKVWIVEAFCCTNGFTWELARNETYCVQKKSAFSAAFQLILSTKMFETKEIQSSSQSSNYTAKNTNG